MMNTEPVNNGGAQIAGDERSQFNAAPGYAALRKDIEDRLSEARRVKAGYAEDGNKRLVAHWWGREAALVVLLQDDDHRMKAPHTVRTHAPAGDRASQPDAGTSQP